MALPASALGGRSALPSPVTWGTSWGPALPPRWPWAPSTRGAQRCTQTCMLPHAHTACAHIHAPHTTHTCTWDIPTLTHVHHVHTRTHTTGTNTRAHHTCMCIYSTACTPCMSHTRVHNTYTPTPAHATHTCVRALHLPYEQRGASSSRAALPRPGGDDSPTGDGGARAEQPSGLYGGRGAGPEGVRPGPLTPPPAQPQVGRQERSGQARSAQSSGAQTPALGTPSTPKVPRGPQRALHVQVPPTRVYRSTGKMRKMPKY